MFAEWMLIWAAIAGPTGFLIMILIAGIIWGREIVLRRQLRREQQEFKSSQSIILEDLQLLQKENALRRIESRLLHDMLHQPNLQGMIDVVLRAIQPLQQGAFVAFFRAERGERFYLNAHRGLTAGSKANLVGKSILFSQVSVKEQQPNCSLLDQADLLKLLSSYLNPDDLARAKDIHGFFMHAGKRPVGVVVTTRLFPVGFDPTVQMESTREILSSLAVACSYAYEYENQQSDLQLSSEILALRAIMDADYPSPLKMLEGFCSHLLTKMDSQRAVLYLAQSDTQLPDRPIIEIGKMHSLGVQKRWQEYERRLARLGHCQTDPDAVGLRVLLRRDLEELQVASLIGTALVAPIVREHKILGVLCMTRPENNTFSEQQIELVNWATDFLAETIVKTVNHAAVVRDARIDALTGLCNRLTFEKSLTTEIDRALNLNSQLTLCLIDADHFKKVNDHYGHQAGDDVLRFLGRLIRTEAETLPGELRPIACRYGGEELAILFPNLGHSQIFRFADQLRDKIETSKIISEGTTIPVTVSIGISSLHEHAADRTSLLKAADEALYEAKKSGRNRVCRAAKLEVTTAVP